METEYFYPTFREFITLAVLVVVLCGAGGWFLSWRRDRWPNGTPLWVTVAVGCTIAAIYISVTWYLVDHSFWKRRPTVILYALAFWAIPLAFYTRLIMNALATTTVDKLSWLDVRIGDTSEFTMARQLADRGDIDGAVRVYRNYTRNKLGALKEAAHLLQASGRPEDAANLHLEITERFPDNRPAVNEAWYRVGLIYEKELGDFETASTYYGKVYKQSPESEWGRQAAQSLRRSLGDGDRLMAALDAAYGGGNGDATPKEGPTTNPHPSAATDQ